MRVAIPGVLTTAYLTLKIFAPEIETVSVPFDRIIPEVLAGNFDAGLIIHEGQLTYSHSGLQKVIDLGQWWREQTGLPAAARRQRYQALSRSRNHADRHPGASRLDPARAR